MRKPVIKLTFHGDEFRLMLGSLQFAYGIVFFLCYKYLYLQFSDAVSLINK